MTSENPHRFRQILPVLIASLTGVSFGTMLGWPSLAFPLLVDKERSPVLITWDLSAALAGCLMWGNIIGTFFSSLKFPGSKLGILFGCISQIGGWIIMYYVDNTGELAISRILVGIGNGFALGQIRIYATETCEPKIAKKLMQYMPLGINVGVIIVYIFGLFASFRNLSVLCVMIPVAAFFLFAAIPKKPYLLDAETNSTETSNQTKEDQNKQTQQQQEVTGRHEVEQLGFIAGFKDKEIRMRFLVLWFLIFIPQYTGGAANVVYNQVIHIAALNPYPKVCSVIYSFVFLFSNIVALKYTHKFPRKPILVASCIICALLLCAVCFYFYFLIDLLEVSPLFAWSPLFLLSLYNFFHTIGVNTIPILYITDKFPENARIIGSKFYVMYFSLSALLSTKVFQVFFSHLGMYTAYIFTCVVGVVCGFIVLFFIKEPSDSKISKNLQGFENNIDLEEEIDCDKKEAKETSETACYEIKDEVMNDRNKRDGLRATNNFDVIEIYSNDVPHRNAYYNEVDLSDEIVTASNKTSSNNERRRSESNSSNVKRKTETPLSVIEVSASHFKVIPQRKLYQNDLLTKDNVMTRL